MRDLSRATVTAAPAQFSSWNEARSELMLEKKKPLKAQLAGELAAAADDAERTSIRVQSFPASPATCHATHSDRLALLLLGRI